ncbi:hypothetical protein SAMN05660772_01529 [Pasteurella testudinis DSM 23072]|uniref:Uncharacterized protein n=1 Tax=Pasteurella testudinis DSM 23072 TaxID=1122938 RepID=A0A1W1VB79_9PAST|nr:hypothetical protein [Pasteurella testudinis]SMB90483.1 hypothetical protein SAMN05660772_01529 [Pasteurella testudinis DSM 23072]SUB52805.1 Uncharacterised protein [Pasteurella testudinis]
MEDDKRKILLGLSAVNGISELIERNLKYYGFDVTNICEYDQYTDKYTHEFRYPSLLSNFLVKYKKIIFKDKQAKVKLKSKLIQSEFLKNVRLM